MLGHEMYAFLGEWKGEIASVDKEITKLPLGTRDGLGLDAIQLELINSICFHIPCVFCDLLIALLIFIVKISIRQKKRQNILGLVLNNT